MCVLLGILFSFLVIPSFFSVVVSSEEAKKISY